MSRLGMPLVNEVVIGLKDKNLFNAAHPLGDAALATYITNPTLPEILQLLFPVQAPKHFRASISWRRSPRVSKA